MTPLHNAASGQCKECLELLLSHKAHVNAKMDVSNHNKMSTHLLVSCVVILN